MDADLVLPTLTVVWRRRGRGIPHYVPFIAQFCTMWKHSQLFVIYQLPYWFLCPSTFQVQFTFSLSRQSCSIPIRGPTPAVSRYSSLSQLLFKP